MAHPADEPVCQVRLQDCLVRFQIPRAGQMTQKARVTPDSMGQGAPQCTPDAVAATINNFSNHFRTNAALWLWRDAWSMVYAGVDKGPFDNTFMRPPPQHGLDADDVAVTIILPTGRAKLRIVHAPLHDVPGAKQPVVPHLVGVNIEDEANPLVAGDFAYTMSKVLTEVLKSWRTVFRHRYTAGFIAATSVPCELHVNVESSYGGILSRALLH